MKHDGNDLLRRQDCIEAIEGITCSMSLCVNADECHGMQRMQRQAVIELANMPAVQPERTEYIPETKAIRSKRDCVDLSELVSTTFYDQEYEEWTQKTVPIAEVLDSVCDEYTILPVAQPEPLSDAYMKAVYTWLLNYQNKAAELKGRYTPYEVLSWVVNDWRKEHE